MSCGANPQTFEDLSIYAKDVPVQMPQDIDHLVEEGMKGFDAEFLFIQSTKDDPPASRVGQSKAPCPAPLSSKHEGPQRDQDQCH